MRIVLGPALANCETILVKQPVPHEVPASALAEAVNTAGPPWNGGPLGFAGTVIATAYSLPSHANCRLGKKPEVNADPLAISVPAACSTPTFTNVRNIVSVGSNAGHETLIGMLIATRPIRCGVPKVTVICCAEVAVGAITAPTIATIAQTRKHLLKILLSLPQGEVAPKYDSRLRMVILLMRHMDEC
jgi:hypothetical protein